MVPTRDLRNQAMILLASDTSTLAAVAANQMGLFMNNASPSENSVLSDFTPADFTGSGTILIHAGVQPEGFVPTTGDSRIDFSPPIGGFRWEASALTNLPQTIYGYYIMDNAGLVLLAAERFDTPIVLTQISDAVVLSDPSLTLLANSIN